MKPGGDPAGPPGPGRLPAGRFTAGDLTTAARIDRIVAGTLT
jgi:hypothetical protein